MSDSNFLRSLNQSNLFEGRVPNVILDLSKSLRNKIVGLNEHQGLSLVYKNIQQYYDNIMWSTEKEEWNKKMNANEKASFVEAFYNRLKHTKIITENTAIKKIKTFDVKNEIECQLYNETVHVSYKAYQQNQQNINMFVTIPEENIMDLLEVVDDNGINIIDDLTDHERRDIEQQCWENVDLLIAYNKK